MLAMNKKDQVTTIALLSFMHVVYPVVQRIVSCKPHFRHISYDLLDFRTEHRLH